MGLGNFKFKWFQRGKKEKEEEAQRLVMEELQGLKKILRKQSVLMEEVRRGQESLAAGEDNDSEPLIGLCDSIFYLHRAFHNPGLMSRQHAQVLTMVLTRLHRFAASLDLELILDEGTPFDPDIHEAVANRSPGSRSLEVIEVISPGYVQSGKVLRPAKVIVGNSDDSASISEGTRLS